MEIIIAILAIAVITLIRIAMRLSDIYSAQCACNAILRDIKRHYVEIAQSERWQQFIASLKAPK